MSSIPTDQKSLKKLTSRRHPEFVAKLDHWEFLHETCKGTRDWFEKHIFQFNREGSATYKGRINRAYRFNHTREVVELVNKYLFKVPAERAEDVPEHLKTFRGHATMSGLELNEFERQVARAASMFGRVYVVVDNNFVSPDGEAPVSKADERNVEGLLYAYIVYPMDFLDCGYDTDGQYSWVMIQERHRDDADPFNSTGDVISKFRIWTKEGWYLFKQDGKGKIDLEETGLHNLGAVPVLKCDHIESDEKYAVPALIEDIAYLDRAIANYLSNLDQIINDQTFSQLTMPAQGLLNGAPKGNDADAKDPLEQTRQEAVRMGTSQVLLYDGEHGSAPSYISPDPRQANLILAVVRQIINEIYHTVGLAGERTKQDNSMGIDNSSGVAKAFDFERVNALLSAKANAMQSFSNRLEILVRMYYGEDLSLDERSEDTVTYPTNFDVRNLIEDLSIANELALMSAPIEIRRVQMEAIVSKLWPLMPEAEMKKLQKAIEDWEDALPILPAPPSKTPAKASDGKPGQGAVGGKEVVAGAGKVE